MDIAEAATPRPPLKWAGGKRWLVPRLKGLWMGHEHRRLVEPFVGGASIALGLKPATALLSDVNAPLVNFYRWLQRGLVIKISTASDEDSYYKQRNRFNSLIGTPAENSKLAAMLFYYLNRNCFNGLCRFNRNGKFNTPHGRYKHPRVLRDLTSYRHAMRGWKFRQGDFETIKLLKSDFVYADPPYDQAFSDYAKREFTWEDQKRLANWLSKHNGPAIISNAATPRVIKIYEAAGFDCSTVLSGPRMISANGDRKPVREVLAVKNL